MWRWPALSVAGRGHPDRSEDRDDGRHDGRAEEAPRVRVRGAVAKCAPLVAAESASEAATARTSPPAAMRRGEM
jgi:hypothetical protein